MSFLVIGDEETVLGFSLAGIEGTVARNSEEARTALEDALSEKEADIIIITERIARDLGGLVISQQMSGRKPLIIEIPDRHGPLPDRKSVAQLIKEAVGIQV